MMGTRSGDIDPAIPLYMLSCGLTAAEIDRMLNKESGLKGISGISNDMRDLVVARDKGEESAALAMDMYVHRIVKYIGSYFALLPRTDMSVLTGGVGENSKPIRKMICEGLVSLGIQFDEQRNEAVGGGVEGDVTSESSRIPIRVIPTDEELMIAQDTLAIVSKESSIMQ